MQPLGVSTTRVPLAIPVGSRAAHGIRLNIQEGYRPILSDTIHLFAPVPESRFLRFCQTE